MSSSSLQAPFSVGKYPDPLIFCLSLVVTFINLFLTMTAIGKHLYIANHKSWRFKSWSCPVLAVC